jgi:hypothetical protein
VRLRLTDITSSANEIMSVDRIEGLDGLSFYQAPN